MKQNIITRNICLSNYTTIKIGGISEYFAEPSNIFDFTSLIEWSHSKNYNCRIIGAGSNLLINNIFINGLIICTKKMRSVSIDPHAVIIEAEAGVMLPTLSNLLAKNGLQGGEWAIGIPGTLGGAICMNAGSGDLSLANNLISVKVTNTKTLERMEIEGKDIDIKYRFSPFLENNLVIISAKMHFKPKGNVEKLIKKTKNNLKLKTEKQPYHLPSFGSVFKNPKNNFAA